MVNTKQTLPILKIRSCNKKAVISDRSRDIKTKNLREKADGRSEVDELYGLCEGRVNRC